MLLIWSPSLNVLRKPVSKAEGFMMVGFQRFPG